MFFSSKERDYLFITIMLLLVIFPAFLGYSIDKNGKRIVMIASLAAIASIGRLAFFMLPQFKPVLAIVIISSVTLGSYEGFLVGALTGFLSNFYFGQGPWTVWQMFCFGLVGFLAGLLFQKKRPGVIGICLYGFLVTMIVYGGIMNFYSAMMLFHHITKGTLLASYASGIPFDFIHAVSTVVFLGICYQPFCKKIERIKLKYEL